MDTIKIYQYLFHVYGRQWGIWFGLFTEIVRAIIARVVTVILLAQMVQAVAEGDFERAKSRVFLWAGLTLFTTLLSAFGEIVALRGENSAYGKSSVEVYRRLINKDMAFYRNNKSGYLTSAFRQHVDSGLLLVRFTRGEVVRTAVSLTLPIVVLFVADLLTGFVAFILLCVQVAYIFWSTKKTSVYRKQSHEIYRELSGEVSDDITNIVAFRSSGNETYALRRMNTLMDKERRIFGHRRMTVVGLNLPRAIITTTLVAAAFLSVLNSSAGSQTVSLLVLTITYMFQIVRNVDDLPQIFDTYDDHLTKFYPTLSIVSDKDEAVRDVPEPKKLVIKKGTVELRNVTFAYGENKKRHVFNRLNLSISGGEKVGIVGLSGAGKSTLANLLLRFDDVVSGTIEIDGTDIASVAQSDLRAHIAYVPQEPLLFHRSIRENIAYHTATATDVDVVKASKAAHVHEFVVGLPDGYDTIVGERGVKLSGGQKQRIVIARAILKKAPIILFDEATSALDSESEHIIQAALPDILGSHTAIIIAHRLSTVAGLDRIIVMHEGKVAEQGTHEQLLAQKGRYYRLWQRQTKSYGGV